MTMLFPRHLSAKLFGEASTNFLRSLRRHLVWHFDDDAVAHVLAKCGAQRTQELRQGNQHQTLVAVRDAAAFETLVKFPGESICGLIP